MPGDRHSETRQARDYASNLGFLGILRGVTRLRGLVLLPVIARMLGTEAYGAWTQSVLFVSVGSSIILMQLDAALVRFVSGTESKREQREIYIPLLLVVMGLGVVLTVATLISPRIVASLILGEHTFVDVAKLLGFWTGLSALAQLGMQLQRGLHRLKLFGILSTAELFGQLLFVTLALFSFRTLSSAVWGAIVWELGFLIVLLFLGIRQIGVSWPNWDRLKEAFRYSLPLVPSQYGALVLAFADRVLIAAQLGAEAVGLYAAAYSLARVVREAFLPIRTSLLPAVSRTWDQGLRGQARRLLQRTIYYYGTLAIPAVSGLAILGARGLRVLAPQAVVPITPVLITVLAVGYLFTGLEDIFAIVLQVVKKTKYLAVSRGIPAIIYILLVVPAVRSMGLLGGALASATIYMVELVASMLFAQGEEHLDVPVSQFLKATLASIGMAYTVWRVTFEGTIGLVFGLLVGLVTYMGLMVLARGVGRKELEFAATLLPGWLGTGKGGTD